MRTSAIGVTTWLGLVMCLGVQACAADEANDPEIQLAKSKMAELKPAFQKYHQAVEALLSANEQAARENPDFGPGVTGLLRIKEMRAHGLPGEDESAKYRAEDPEGWKKLFELSEGPFAQKVMAENLREPNLAGQLRPALLLEARARSGWIPEQREKFMAELRTESYTVFDPNDPNDEQLWQNIKRLLLERAERGAQYRKRLLEEQGVPQWMAERTGYYRFTDGMGEWLGYWLAVEMPDEVFEAAEQVRACIKTLNGIYPSWRRIERLLLAETPVGNAQAINYAARQWDAVVEGVNRIYPSSSPKRIDPGPSGDGSFDHRKAFYMADKLRIIFLEAEDRPGPEIREQYRQRRFIERSERR